MKLERWAGILAVLNLAAIALLWGAPSFSNASRPVRGITSPMLAMELARNMTEVDAILSDAPSPDREVMRIKQYAGFGFIACYAALFVVLSRMLAGRGKWVATAAASLGVAAAIFDVMESAGILRIVDVGLAHTTQGMIDAIRYPSLIKWALVPVAVGLIAALLWRTGRRGLRVVAALEFLGALLGLYGLAENAMILRQGLPELGGLVGLAILYFRPF